jgi:hypothetical protein
MPSAACFVVARPNDGSAVAEHDPGGADAGLESSLIDRLRLQFADVLGVQL